MNVKGRIVDGAVREGVGANGRAGGHCLAMGWQKLCDDEKMNIVVGVIVKSNLN